MSEDDTKRYSAEELGAHLTELVLGYRDFNTIAPTTTWDAVALVIGTGLLFIPRTNPFLVSCGRRPARSSSCSASS